MPHLQANLDADTVLTNSIAGPTMTARSGPSPLGSKLSRSDRYCAMVKGTSEMVRIRLGSSSNKDVVLYVPGQAVCPRPVY
jgi:hypothetical protein